MTALRQKRDQHLSGEPPEGRRSVGSLDCIDTAISLGDNHQIGPVQLAFLSSSAPASPSCKRGAKDWRIRNTAPVPLLVKAFEASGLDATPIAALTSFAARIQR